MPDGKRAAERRQLEDALSGRGPYPHRPPAVRGRLAQLILEESSATATTKRRALGLVNEALGSVASDDPLYPKLLHVKATALRALLDGSKEGNVSGEAADMDRQAWRLSYDNVPQEALLLAREWADWAWDGEVWEEAAEAYDLAHRALRRIILRATDGINPRFELLGAFVGVGTRGAFAYFQSKRAKEALVLLERVASLLSLANEDNADLLRLDSEGHGELRHRIFELQKKVSAARETFGHDSYGHISPAERNAQAELDEVVIQARRVPGFSRFAMPAGWSDIEEAAAAIPLVYLVPTDKGSAIALVPRGAREIVHSVLPVTRQQIYEAAKPFLQNEFGDQRTDSSEQLMALLEWLGPQLHGPCKVDAGETRN